MEDVIPRYRDVTFKSHFRLRKASAEKLCTRLAHSQTFIKKHSGGKPEVPLPVKLLIFLWYSASKEPLRSISDRFNVVESCIHKIIRKITNAIIEVILPGNIIWPTGNRVKEISDGFELFKGIAGVIGAIDGTHIPIMGQGEFNVNYINRKGFPSIVLQGVVDHNNGTFMVGDGAYKLEQYMLTPYKDHGFLTAKQKRYNICQSSTRMVVERSFGLLKSRFQRLKHIEIRQLEPLCRFVLAVCCLHNFCIYEDKSNNDKDLDFIVEPDEEINNFICYGSSSKDAERKRDSIASLL